MAYRCRSTNCSEWTAVWKSDKTDGYYETTCPSYNNDAEYVENGILKMEYDPARTILGGEWQLPTKDIWNKLCDDTNYEWQWTTQDGYNGCKVTSKSDNSKTIFLPAAGYVTGVTFTEVGSYGRYWSGTAGTAETISKAYCLRFSSGDVSAQSNLYRHFGLPMRPVRLVEVSESQQ